MKWSAWLWHLWEAIQFEAWAGGGHYPTLLHWIEGREVHPDDELGEAGA